MATNRDLLKEAIADARAVKETAIANAKAALEEAFTPYLKEKLAAKINEMDEAEDMEEMMYDEAEAMDEMKKKEDMEEEVSLDELLAELEEEKDEMKEEKDMEETYMEEELHEAEKAEEEMSIEDMSEEDLKSFIEDVIKDMVAAGELEAGEEMEGEEEDEEEMEMGAEEEGEEELDEEINLDELLAEAEEVEEEEKIEEEVVSGLEILAGLASMGLLAGGAAAIQSKLEKSAKENPNGTAAKILSFLKSTKTNAPTSRGSEKLEEELNEAYSTIETLKSDLHEINLLNAKLLYTNKIFRNKSLTESQKIKVLTAFDKATSKKEVELVYETLQESLKVSTTKAPIKESLGSASKVLGNASAKPIIEVDNQFARWQQLAGIKK